MGRRKIEIKAIKDDRNRSVTFLKRKGGLFKKAHELSVLCSVDVAVIIFGNNKKLYEYSSGDINDSLTRFYHYQGPHDHKGPVDFNGKGGLEEEDDEEVEDTVQEDMPPEHTMQEHGLPSHLQNQPAFQQLRQGASASPPIVNGTAPFYQRQHTPQGNGSRPISRNDGIRPPSNLGPQHQVTHAPALPNGYSYMPNPPMYHTHAPQHPGHPQYQYPHPPAPLVQIQQAYLQEQRRQSMPAMPPHERHLPHHGQHMQTPPPPQAEPPPRQDLLQQPKPVPTKSKSIFTPIDDSRSILAQHWGSSPRQEYVKVEPESLSPLIDVTMAPRENRFGSQGLPLGSNHHGISSISSAGGDLLGAKRPKLNLQIPSEQSDDGGSATAGSTPHGSGDAGETTGKTESSGNNASGVVLPPPSPSASALLSAGAQGPPNPFARPLLPGTHTNSQAFTSNSNVETPMSGLPSRFVSDGLLPSPSTFFAGWVDGNMLPSPLNFQTPVTSNGPSFGREDDGQNKRKSPDEAQVEPGGSKKVKAS